MKPNGGPAFPVSTSQYGSGEYGHQNGHTTYQYPGMTLRDHFAAQALAECIRVAADQTLDATDLTPGSGAPMLSDLFAKAAAYAYFAADAMLAEREKP